MRLARPEDLKETKYKHPFRRQDYRGRQSFIVRKKTVVLFIIFFHP